MLCFSDMPSAVLNLLGKKIKLNSICFEIQVCKDMGFSIKKSIKNNGHLNKEVSKMNEQS